MRIYFRRRARLCDAGPCRRIGVDSNSKRTSRVFGWFARVEMDVVREVSCDGVVWGNLKL